MSLEDFNFEMQAYNRRKELDEEQRLFEIWLQERVVTATDKEGKNYLFKTFDDLMDRTGNGNSTKKAEVFSELREIALRKREFEKARKEENNE